MTTLPLTHGKTRLSRLSTVVGLFATAVLVFGKRAIEPHKASLRNLQQIPLTVMGIASIDFSTFQLGQFWGFLATGLSLIVLEHLIADEAP